MPLTLGSQQPPANASTPFPLVQLSSNALLPVAATQSCSPSAPPQRRLLRPNPHRACCNRRCPLTAISCLGASRTPAVGARRWRRHAGVRETCTGRDMSHRSALVRNRIDSRPLSVGCGTVAADPAQYEVPVRGEQCHAPMAPNNARRLSTIEWLWSAKRA